MQRNQIFSVASLMLAAAISFTSCDGGENMNGNLQVSFTATGSQTSSASHLRLSEAVTVEEFKINIEEIEIEFDDNDPMFENDSVASDIELQGPFEIDLIKNGDILTKTISGVTIPSAIYKEVEFKFRENELPSSAMFEKSVVIKGTYNGVPFEFWTDEEIEVEVEFEENFTYEEGQAALLRLVFDISLLFDPAKGGIDLADARDGNEDGILQIHPDDPDGNEDLSKAIWDRIEDIIDAFEDSLED